MKILYTSVAILFSLTLLSSAEDQQSTSVYKSVRSPGGFIAHYLRFNTGEGNFEGRVMIEKEGRVIATINGARPVSFSTKADILLVVEDVADDDLKHYLLDIGKGQFTRKAKREDYTFGSRFSSKAVWSDDGKFLVLFDFPGITDAPPIVVKIADKIGK